jgi:hypothetical protein
MSTRDDLAAPKESQPAMVSDPPNALTRKSMDPSRVGAYAALGAATTMVPLPWVPDAFLARLRGTLSHDLAARNGLSLTEDARKVLGEPWSSQLPRSVLAQAARFATARVLSRMGPLGWLSPMRVALSTFVLGHLFQRYLETARTERSIRINADEARKIRKAMDKALLLVFTQEAASPWKSVPHAPEDLRDTRTQFMDGLILSAASLPAWVVERLEGAFDEALSAEHS